MQHYDSIIIGAGHNGLVCASYLAKSGQRVLLLEAAENVGGLAASREFHPGFKVSVAHTLSHFSKKIVDDLKLQERGFNANQETLSTIGLDLDGNHIRLENGELRGVSDDDAKSYQGYRILMQRFADMLKPFWLKTMPRIGMNNLADVMTFAHLGLKMRLLGQRDMREFMRVAALPTRDLMDENFDSDLVKAMLSWDGHLGSKLAPRSPNHAVLAMLYRMAGEQGGNHSVPVGGMPGMMQALLSSATANGVDTRTGATVERILIEANENGLAASGVRMADGETFLARRVVSSADPQRTFFSLAGVENLEIQFCNRIRRLRCQGYVAKLHLALDGLPDFPGLDDCRGRMIIADGLDAIEFAYDDAKYGECSEHPVMEVVLPSVHDASLAPEGKHVLPAHVMYVPCQLKGGWNDDARTEICERAIDTLEKYAPTIRDQIIHSEFLTPKDIEQHYRVTGGHWHHAEFAMDQILMMRPTYEAAQYRTPIPGLFLCGAGSHPGGDVTGAPGHNAAVEILK